MNTRENNYNVYFSKERAQKAVNLMREKLGAEDATQYYNPHIIGKIAEGEAFGEDLNRPGKREYQDLFLGDTPAS